MRIIDATSIRRLGNEFLDSADQVRDFARRLAAGRQGPGTFGSLTDSTLAAGEYDAVTTSALGYLEQLQNAYETFADNLGQAVRQYEMAEYENAVSVSELAPEVA